MISCYYVMIYGQLHLMQDIGNRPSLTQLAAGWNIGPPNHVVAGAGAYRSLLYDNCRRDSRTSGASCAA